MKLVRREAGEGYPREYLLARVKARRGKLIDDWRPLLAGGMPPGLSEDDLWQDLLQEFDWLHRQMNAKLRNIFAPVFAVFEIDTLILCLRNLAAGRRESNARILAFSLLPKKIKEILSHQENLTGALAALAAVWPGERKNLDNLARIQVERGTKGVEEELLRLHLESTVPATLHPLVRRWLVRLIDRRNMLVLFKHLRWHLATPPRFIQGGAIPPQKLAGLLEQGETSALAGPLRIRPGPGQELTGSWLESQLLRKISLDLRRAGRDPEGVGVILDYLWRRYLEAVNFRLLLRARDVPPDRLAAELLS